MLAACRAKYLNPKLSLDALADKHCKGKFSPKSLGRIFTIYKQHEDAERAALGVKVNMSVGAALLANPNEDPADLVPGKVHKEIVSLMVGQLKAWRLEKKDRLVYNAERAIAEARSSFPSWTREYSERALQLAVKVDPDAPDTRGGKRAFTDDEESTLRENLIIAADSDGNQYSMSSLREDLASRISNTDMEGRFKNGAPSKGYIAGLVARGVAREEVGTDQTIINSDLRTRWTTYENIMGWYTDLAEGGVEDGTAAWTVNWTENKKNEAGVPYRELPFAEPILITQPHRWLAIDEMKCKLQKDKRNGKDISLVGFANSREARNCKSAKALAL